jgi:hypothetical protein
MTDAHLADIRARCDEATPGPWEFDRMSDGVFLAASGKEICAAYRPERDADMEFIANARSDIPALLDEVERLRAVAEAARILIAEVEPVIARLDDGGEVGDFTLHLDPLRDAVRARERA